MVAQRIRKLGFRRWHERQLIEAHASLVTAILCVLVVLICQDQFSLREGSGFRELMLLLLIAVGVVISYHTVKAYFKVLFRAEHFAEQAVCSECQTYGVLEVLANPAHETRNIPDESERFPVRCRKCGNSWTMTAMQVRRQDEKVR